MSILSIASYDSKWRAYEYYKEKRVISWKYIDNHRIEAKVSGNQNKVYDVLLNLEKVKSSTCNCTHAYGNTIACKHKIALYFTAFPEKADQYLKELEDAEKEYEAYVEQRKDDIRAYVKSLDLKTLRALYTEVLIQEEFNEDCYY